MGRSPSSRSSGDDDPSSNGPCSSALRSEAGASDEGRTGARCYPEYDGAHLGFLSRPAKAIAVPTARAVAGDRPQVARPMDLDRQLAFQALDDRAVGASVSVAGRCEMLQRVSHFVERLGPLPQFGNMSE